MLFVKDREQQRQIDELATLARETTKLRLLEHEKLKLSAKPKLWLNGNEARIDGKLNIDLNNKGERAILRKFEVLEGDVTVTDLNSSYDLEKGERRYIFAQATGDVKKARYRIGVYYEDEVGTQYESVIEGVGPKAKLAETREV